jgi:hypothetical protein
VGSDRMEVTGDPQLYGRWMGVGRSRMGKGSRALPFPGGRGKIHSRADDEENDGVVRGGRFVGRAGRAAALLRTEWRWAARGRRARRP